MATGRWRRTPSWTTVPSAQCCFTVLLRSWVFTDVVRSWHSEPSVRTSGLCQGGQSHSLWHQPFILRAVQDRASFHLNRAWFIHSFISSQSPSKSLSPPQRPAPSFIQSGPTTAPHRVGLHSSLPPVSRTRLGP